MPEWVGQLLELLVLGLLAYERRRAGHDFTSVRESVDRVSKVVVDSMRPPPLRAGSSCQHTDRYEVPHTTPAVVWCRACGALQRGTGPWRLAGRDSTPSD